jgi:hypothetical protein
MHRSYLELNSKLSCNCSLKVANDNDNYVGFEDLTVAVMNVSIL